MKRKILFLSNDHSVPFAKTTEFMASACERLGHRTVVRDTFPARIQKSMLGDKSLEKPLKRLAIHWSNFLEDLEIDTVIGLDLFWLFYPEPFFDSPQVKDITSIWFDDFRSWITYPTNVWFSSREMGFQSIIRHEKVRHIFYGESMAQEARLFGVERQMTSRLAAPAEFLKQKFPCEIKDKAVFIGNPGFRGEPHKDAIELMKSGADLIELRRMSRDHLLRAGDEAIQKWFRLEPQTRELLAVAMEVKATNPFSPSLQLLKMAGEVYPKAFAFANDNNILLDFCMLVKLVTRYDRPALVMRLYEQGLVDVYSNESEWLPYGVKAGRNINLGELPEYYQKYAVHLNGANPLRDATGNEKLFEIAASGRVSVNLRSPDVISCYPEPEIAVGDTLEELEIKTRALLANPEEALANGAKAKMRTAREHLWDHRLKSILQ
ncbi:MAG: glycosyltransferase [Verrucomicrobiota bacterium]